MLDYMGDRFKAYEEAYESIIIRRLPIIIRCDGKNFSRLTKKIQRPYCPIMTDIMQKTLLESIKEIEGAVFGYQQSDEITFVLKNDQSNDTQPWLKNRVQKIVSIAASTVTLQFNKYLNSLTEKPELIGDALFDARVFAVPSYIEALNALIWRQQDCIRNAVTSAAYVELGKKFGKKTAFKLLEKRTVQERLNMLQKECGIDFDFKYPGMFKRGVGAYKVPLILEGDVSKNKWILDKDIPIFSQDRKFVLDIMNLGHDIYRSSYITT